jgi:hypothetical protein
MVSRLRLVVLALAASLGWSAVASAQNPRCDAWRSELSRIERSGGSPQAARAAQRVAADLGRAQANFAALQCDGAWLFQAPPPQCSAIRGQIGQLRAQYAALQQQADGGMENRRRALMAALNDNCRGTGVGVFTTAPNPPPAQPAQPRNLFEALFGVQEPQRPPSSMPELDEANPALQPQTPSWGSGRPVCVRLCDGFFFPLANSTGGRDGQDEMCQALCPNTETEVFFMGGDGDIQNARQRNGRPYASLANAGRYLRQFDASCSCRTAGQSWAQALAEAEDMIDRRRGDVLVSERQAQEMSRPRLEAPTRREQERLRRQQAAAPAQEAAAAAADAAVQQALDQAGRTAPTAGTDSAGIGPQQLGSRTVGADQGERREVTSAGGERRTVRIVAPNITPGLN